MPGQKEVSALKENKIDLKMDGICEEVVTEVELSSIFY